MKKSRINNGDPVLGGSADAPIEAHCAGAKEGGAEVHVVSLRAVEINLAEIPDGDKTMPAVLKEGQSAIESVPLSNLRFRDLFAETTSVLAGRFGMRHWDLIEDSVQTALAEAMVAWPRNPPDNPSAWVYRAAYRRLLDSFRRDRALIRAYAQIACDESILREPPNSDEIHDETLRMLFFCCTPILSEDARIALALKTVCGFSNRELASAFLTSEETIKKRIQRARSTLSENPNALMVIAMPPESTRIESVLKTVYLILNEGSSSSEKHRVVRDDLMGEAVRLASLLAHDPMTASSAAHALCSLVLFHAARVSQRQTDAGLPIPLPDQDRIGWDQELIALAENHLHQSMLASDKTVYHYEAMIAWHHCKSSDFDSTDWTSIVAIYERLIVINPSSAALVAWAIALSYRDGPEAGMQALQKFRSLFSDKDAQYYAALADCALRGDRPETAQPYFDQAIQHAKTDWLNHWLTIQRDRGIQRSSESQSSRLFRDS